MVCGYYDALCYITGNEVMVKRRNDDENVCVVICSTRNLSQKVETARDSF